MRFSGKTAAARRREPRGGFFVAALTLLLGACATHAPRPAAPTPAPPPTAASTTTTPDAAPKKPKPKPKANAAAAPAAGAAAKPSDGLQLAEVGYYMDVMQGRLQQLSTSGVSVAREGTRIVATASATFELHGARLELDPAHGRAFAAIAKVLAEYRQTRVTIRAHQPADGVLAAACESAVQRYLIGAGAAPQQLAPASAAAGASAAEAPSTATATLDLDIAPLVREG